MQSKLNRSGRVSERNHKAALGVFFCALLFSVASYTLRGAAKSDSQDASEYRNVNYGYAVRVPAGVKLETSKPPNPNHGFGLKPTPATLLWVDASYTDDDSLLAVMASERQIWGDDCQEVAREPTVLGVLRASRMTLHCVGKAVRDAPTSVTVVVALFSQAHNGRIKYEVGFQGPLQGGAVATNAEQVFNKLVKGFYRIPIK